MACIKNKSNNTGDNDSSSTIRTTEKHCNGNRQQQQQWARRTEKKSSTKRKRVTEYNKENQGKKIMCMSGVCTLDKMKISSQRHRRSCKAFSIPNDCQYQRAGCICAQWLSVATNIATAISPLPTKYTPLIFLCEMHTENNGDRMSEWVSQWMREACQLKQPSKHIITSTSRLSSPRVSHNLLVFIVVCVC